MSLTGEKADIQADNAPTDHDVAPSMQSSVTTAEFDAAEERALLRKIDFRVVPLLCIMYCMAFLDRVNIGNAAIYGLKTDLKLQLLQYNTALTIFFVPYVFFEIPSNILLKKLRPHMWLACCMFAFGIISIAQGFVKNYAGLLATRFFLGLFEAGMFPGSFYLIGMWYKRAEAQKRFSFFFGSTTIAGAFGGLLAGAIGNLDGTHGMRGWRWIFIIEGAVTCGLALVFYFFLPDFPEDAKWLTDRERSIAIQRVQIEQGPSGRSEQITVKQITSVFKDYKIFLGGFMYFGLIVPAYTIALFAPSIVKSYGYSNIGTQLHSAPPWICAFAFAMLMAYFSDRLRHRFAFVLIAIAVALAGFIILLTVHTHKKVEYFAIFMITMGIYGALPLTVCWFTMNLEGHRNRAVGTAWQIGFGNVGGIISTYTFIPKDAPEYKPGYEICIGFICLATVASTLYYVAVLRKNKSRQMSAYSGEGSTYIYQS